DRQSGAQAHINCDRAEEQSEESAQQHGAQSKFRPRLFRRNVRTHAGFGWRSGGNDFCHQASFHSITRKNRRALGAPRGEKWKRRKVTCPAPLLQARGTTMIYSSVNTCFSGGCGGRSSAVATAEIAILRRMR